MSSAQLLPAEETPESVYLHPGHVYTASHPALVSTVLGSCVAVCLWDQTTRVGGMNHFLLTAGRKGDPRYAGAAMQRLVEEMIARGALVPKMVAKVFGGACVIPGFTGARQAIGAQNSEAALRFLAANGIPVRATQVGGSRGRKLLFHTGSGHAYVKDI
jgi:chemotaxis protein CheD